MPRARSRHIPAPASRGYSALLGDVKHRIRTAQYAALRAVNTELVALYWDIGRLIIERQQGASWGKRVVTRLSRDLHAEFPGIAGFSPQNLWFMRQLYAAYRDKPKLWPMVREIGWSHNLIIVNRCRDDLEREFYLRMTRRMGWTKTGLIHEIENRTYEKTLAAQTNFVTTLPEPMQQQAALAVKDEYTFDFLELGGAFSERQLEAAILAKVEPFLREMGGVFAFVGHQYPLRAGEREYFVDLLLFHRGLKALVAVEIKVGEFIPEYVGKMQFYLALLDDTVRAPDELPSIGIILCKSRDRTIVEYALRESRKPIGVAAYRMVRALPKELVGQLPAPDQITKLLAGLAEGEGE